MDLRWYITWILSLQRHLADNTILGNNEDLQEEEEEEEEGV